MFEMFLTLSIFEIVSEEVFQGMKSFRPHLQPSLLENTDLVPDPGQLCPYIFLSNEAPNRKYASEASEYHQD